MPNATISDVAAQARVSIKTVSRVINNVPTVKPHTRERVLRVIRKLDYHPSPSARGLSGSSSYLIGLLYELFATWSLHRGRQCLTVPPAAAPVFGENLTPPAGQYRVFRSKAA